MKRTPLRLLVALALTMVVFAAPPAAPATSGPDALSGKVYEKRVRKWINMERVEHRLQPLERHRCAKATAERWARHLADTDRFYHQSMGRLLNRCDAYYAGETIGRGSIWPRRLVSMWMHSPPHRAVLLSRHPNHIGIGAVRDGHGQWLTAANFIDL